MKPRSTQKPLFSLAPRLSRRHSYGSFTSPIRLSDAAGKPQPRAMRCSNNHASQRQSTLQFSHISSFDPLTHFNITIPILETRKLRLREVTQLVSGELGFEPSPV